MSVSSKSSSSSLEKSQPTGLIKNKLINDKSINLSQSSESSSLVKFDQKRVSSKNSSKSSLTTVKDDVESSKESFILSKGGSTASVNLVQDSNFEITSASHEIIEKSNKSEPSTLKNSTSSKASNSNIDLSQSFNENSGQISNKVPVFSRERNLGIKKLNKNITNETASKELTESLKSENSSSISSLVRNDENADDASENTKLGEASQNLLHKSSTSLDNTEGIESKTHESKLDIESEKTNNVENDKLSSSTVTNKLTSKKSLENVSEKLQESEVTTKTSAKVIPSVTQIDNKVECSASVKSQSSSSSSNDDEKTSRVSSADTMRSVRSISPDFKDANPEVADQFDHKKFLSTLNKLDVKKNVERKEVPVKEKPEKKVFKNKVRDLIIERFGLPHHLKARMNASLFISGAVSLV